MQYKFQKISDADVTEEGMIEGYASRFGVKDSYDDIIVQGAFSDTLKSARWPKMLWQHDSQVPIGRWDEIVEDKTGLRVTGHINLKTSAGKNAFEHILHKDVDGLSIGYLTKPEKTYTKNNIRYLGAVDLFEVSVVTIPADMGAQVDMVKAAAAGNYEELKPYFERAGRDVGLSKSDARAAAGGAIAGIEKTLDRGPDPRKTEALLKEFSIYLKQQLSN